jgi:hypothetical protein
LEMRCTPRNRKRDAARAPFLSVFVFWGIFNYFYVFFFLGSTLATSCFISDDDHQSLDSFFLHSWYIFLKKTLALSSLSQGTNVSTSIRIKYLSIHTHIYISICNSESNLTILEFELIHELVY